MFDKKFRAWNEDLSTPRMEYFGIADISRTFEGGMGQDTFILNLDVIGVDGSIIKIKNIMEYTGLKDKNGKEIYDGDFIKTKGQLAIVRWNNKFAFFEANFGDGDEIQIWEAKDAEVIGNKFENPNLLDMI